MAKGKGKDKKKVAPKSKVKPTAKKVSKPVKKAAAKPAKKVAKPASKVKAKPVAKKVVVKAKAKAVTKKVVVKAKPKAKPVAKKVAVKPKAKVVNKPVAKKPALKAKPVAVKKAVAPKVVAKPQPKVVAKPVQSAQKPVEPKAKVVAKPVVNPMPKHDAINVAKPLYKTNMKKPETIVREETNLRYSDEELKEFKELIDKKLNAAREELKNLKEALENHTESQAGNKAWNMEEGTDTSEMETLMNQISRQHQYIRNLELALVRVENKTYGICRATGRLIPKERLRIVPHATLSLEAKMTRKTDDVSPGAGLSAPPSDFSEGFED